MGTPVPAVTSTCAASLTWFTEVPRTWRLDEIPGLQGLGTLAPGALGDVTILDPDATWTVDPEAFASKGKNTPLGGKTLKGRVVATIANGRLVHETERMVAL